MIEKQTQMKVKFDPLIKQRDEKIEHLEIQLKDMKAFEQDKKIDTLGKKFNILKEEESIVFQLQLKFKNL